MDIVKLLMKLGVNIVIILSGPCGHSEASNEAGGQYCYYPLRAMCDVDIVKLLMKLGVNIVIILSGPCGHSEAPNEARGQYCYYPLRAM